MWAQIACMFPKTITNRRGGRPVNTSRNSSIKPSNAHAQASHVSPRTKANNTAQQRAAEHASTSYNRRPTYQDAVHVPPQDHHQIACKFPKPCFLEDRSRDRVYPDFSNAIAWNERDLSCRISKKRDHRAIALPIYASRATEHCFTDWATNAV